MREDAAIMEMVVIPIPAHQIPHKWRTKPAQKKTLPIQHKFQETDVKWH